MTPKYEDQLHTTGPFNIPELDDDFDEGNDLYADDPYVDNYDELDFDYDDEQDAYDTDIDES